MGAGCAALAASALCLGATAAPALGAHPLEPDLVTLPMEQDDLVLDQNGRGKNRQSILRMTNEVGNQGDGPLEIRASDASSNCDGDNIPDNDRIARQRIYEDSDDSDDFDRDTDTDYSDSEIGCLKYHPAHFHWHVLDFSKYTLYSEETGKPTDGTKVGFCLGDSNDPFGSTGSSYYSFSGCGSSGQPGGPPVPPLFMGISVGWADIYGSSTPGQRIRVTGLPRGRYCLRSKADPENNLSELDDSNNAYDLRIHLNLADAKVKALTSACRL
jgi:hypothetical protein